MEKFKQWYTENYLQISWFIIGWMTLRGITELASEQYIRAAISFGLVAINYSFVKRD